MNTDFSYQCNFIGEESAEVEYVTSLSHLHGDRLVNNVAAFEQKIVSGRLGMPGGKSPRHAQSE